MDKVKVLRSINNCRIQNFKNYGMNFTKEKKITILGIETSCDDTGVAIVDSSRKIISESLYSQQNLHLKYGGIIPPRAQDLHRENIEKAVRDCLAIDVSIEDLDAIAVTNCPGLPLSLIVGLRYAKYLCRLHNKPLIPIHHMEAHALCARIHNPDIQFPFLCLLISGGHCQLVVVKDAFDFLFLGETLDDAPGEAFDKIARRLRLRNLPKYEWMNGGAAIELAAKEATNSDRFKFPLPLARKKDCNFSFAGLKNTAVRIIKQIEQEYEVKPDEVIPYYRDFCAAFLKACTRHLSYRTQRAIEFCEKRNIFPNSKYLVISGGVACNDFIFDSISKMALSYKFKTVRPTKALCRDNGAMIAWCGIEKILENPDLLKSLNLDEVDIIGKCKLGKDISEDLENEQISCKWVKVAR
ncbi:probable tRNA N6-adenosine threonylcarbamoyltransferase, mitochondrial [Condylostylus longicornis]|uniref:probable tRNA N6-adenosine threonylcarbamoyltransferase, mitochondrial n=1 Tax=Condylostylus longicornis TaxID=2530218 RepID=UPI00244DB0A3|nr:probable tRNA N6-adenosine threonylcarbamoyltransferase, mitochondrial [Condylostylus longicornis]